MENVYRLGGRKLIIYLLVFFMASGMVTYMSVENTMEYKTALEKYDEGRGKEGSNTEIEELIESMSRERESERYAVRALGTLIICAIELIILYQYFLKTGRVIVDEEGIKVHTMFKEKPREVYAWEHIGGIKFQYGEGIWGLVSEHGMKIGISNHSGGRLDYFVPTGRLLCCSEIPKAIERHRPDLAVEFQTDAEKGHMPIPEIFNGACTEYKSGIGDYMKYSIIILVFALLKIVLKAPLINLMAIAGSIYFGYLAKIGMNYRAFMSQRREYVDFDMGWEHAKIRIGRYFGAAIAVELIMLVFIGLGYLCLASNLEVVYKVLWSMLLAAAGLFTVHRIYLIPYIASLADKNVSYTSLNALLIKKYSREVAFAVAVSAIQLLPVAAVMGLYHGDTYVLMETLDKAKYANIAIGVFMFPYMSCFVMKFLDMPAGALGGGDCE